MLRWIIGSSLKSHRAVVVGAAVVMLAGMWQLQYSKVDVLPEFGPPTVEVQTEALGLSAEEVEQLITVPLEQDLLAGVAWLDTIRSRSVPGLSSVQLVFEDGTDLYRARQVVQERISQAAGLPNVSRPPQMLEPRSSSSRTMMISLSSTEISPLEIGVLTRWTIRPQLLAVPGVANVAIWGQRERQLQVQVDPQKLKDNNITLAQVVSSTGNALWVSPLTFLEASSPGTGGFIDTPQQRIGIQHNLPIIDPADLAEIPLDESGAAQLTLGDVATVVEDHQPLIGDAVVDDGADSGFMMLVEKLPEATTSEVTAGVEEALADLGPALSGLQIDTSGFRAADYVDESVSNVTRSLLIGVALMVVMLTALFVGWRKTVVTVISIALSFVVAALVLNILEVTVNMIVFAGLVMALGATVADSIVNVENVVRRFEDTSERDAGADTDAMAAHGTTIIGEAAFETGRNSLWATIMFAIALGPIFLMSGFSGDEFFPVLAAVCLVVLVASLLVAVIVTPALSLLLLSKAPSTTRLQRMQLLPRLAEGYGRALPKLARNPIPMFAAAGILIAAAVVVPGMQKSLLPDLRERDLLVQWNGAFGTSLPEMDRITARASAELRTVPGVRNVAAQLGQALLGDQPVGSESAQMLVGLDPDADYDSTVAAVNDVLDGYPGVSHEVLTYSKEKLRTIPTGTNDKVTVRVFGQDLDVLDDKAAEIKALAAGIEGVAGVSVASRATEPTIEVEVDLAKAEAAGIKPGDVRRGAATLLSGLRVGSLFQDQKVFDVMVWSTPASRQSVSSVRDLLIDTPNGELVRLGDVADVRVRATPPSIQHQGISRYVDVTVDVDGRNVDDVARDVRGSLAQIDFPLEYHAELLSDYADQENAVRQLWGWAIAAAIGLLLLFQARFGSWRLATITWCTLPVAVAGGVLAAWLDDGPMTLATIAGLLAVLAIAIRNNVTVVARYERRRNEGAAIDADVLDRGARDVFTPIVMSALTIVVILLPAVAFGVIAGQEILHPMALVMLGGLATTAFVNLLVVPLLYLRFGAGRVTDLRFELDRLEAAMTDDLVSSAGFDGGR